MATFAEAINEALHIAMRNDPKVICYGLGVTDPKRIFGTTNGLVESYTESRVFDMPASENAMTGVGIGLSIGGYRPILVHQRVDFALLSIDQIVNAAAKWRIMFGGKLSVPFVIRMVIGRGWGQGPTHSQTFHSLFSQVPGLKVVLPSTPSDAKGLMLSSIFSNDPVIFMEHRWLHNSTGKVPEGDYRVPLGKATITKEGSDVTIVSHSQMTIEALRAAEFCEANGVSVEIIDLRSVRPIDWETVVASINKTGRLIALDIGPGAMSIASEVISHAVQNCWEKLESAPIKIAMPDKAVPTSYSLTANFYPDYRNIISAIAKICSKSMPNVATKSEKEMPHDVPGEWFKGPF